MNESTVILSTGERRRWELTRWPAIRALLRQRCDPNHPRMRGILEVRDPAQIASARPFLGQDVTLHDLDMPREAPAIPPALPSAARGQALYAERCAACHGVRGEGTDRAKAIARGETLQERSPAQIYESITCGRSRSTRPAEPPCISKIRIRDAP